VTESGGQGLLLSRIAGGKIDRGVAEALLTRICHASPGSYNELSPGAREAFLNAAVALRGDGPNRERIVLHYLGSLLFDQADRCYEELIERNPDGAADLLRRKGALFGIVNADVAAAAYARLLEMRPDDDRSRLNLDPQRVWTLRPHGECQKVAAGG
jgi:tetratricopeptide (TPR) repeat protein